MPHIHVNPGNHDLTVSAYIVSPNFETKELELLFHQHKKVKKLMVPGGHVELNENPWAALTHEILEETGYEITQLKVLQPAGIPPIDINDGHTIQHPIPFLLDTHLMETGITNHNHINLSYLFYTTQKPLHEVTGDESTVFQQLNTTKLTLMNENEILPSMRKTGIWALDLVARNLWV